MRSRPATRRSTSGPRKLKCHSAGLRMISSHAPMPGSGASIATQRATRSGYAAQYPDRVARWVAMDAPLPGIGAWDEIIRSPALWHFNFRGPDVERLVAGRERIYLDRFWNELSDDPK